MIHLPIEKEVIMRHSDIKLDKREKAPSSTMWYAFLTDSDNHEVIILAKKTQKELKQHLTGLDNQLEVHFIVRGKGFKARVQRSFDFVDGPTECPTLIEAKTECRVLDLLKNEE
jgi:hypothetical protein